MQEGILDYVAHSHHIHAEMDRDSDDPFRPKQDSPQLEAFLRLADITQTANSKKVNQNLDQSQEMENKDYAHGNETYKSLVNDVINQRQLPSAKLNT